MLSNEATAFFVVVAAGASTALGSAVVFFPALVKLASRKTLASSLGLSAGVMTYVSFVEILQKSNVSFVQNGFPVDDAYIYASLCFFAGVLLMVTLNHIVTGLLGGHHHGHEHHHEEIGKRTASAASRECDDHGCCDEHNNNNNNVADIEKNEDEGKEVSQENIGEQQQQQQTPTSPCMCCSEDPANELAQYHEMAEQIENYENEHHQHWEGAENGTVQDANEHVNDTEQSQSRGEVDEKSENQKLMRMSLNTAMAIGLHNFPEGLATFVATLNDPKVGAVLAVAIAIHNIPEGLCVSMPIYYATGKRWKAFLWGVLSGISEPIAALLGWIVLANAVSQTAYAILFGLVAGMMVIISARELLPTAHRYDPDDCVVTYSFMAGMAIMALSLILFRL